MILSQHPSPWSDQSVLGTVANQLLADCQPIEAYPNELALMRSLSQRNQRLHVDDSYIVMDCHAGKRIYVQIMMPQSDTRRDAAYELPSALF